MNDRQFEPGNPGWSDPAAKLRAGSSQKHERRQAGTPATLEGNIDNAIDEDQDTGERLQHQAYPIRWLKQRYGLSLNYASLVAAEFRWGVGR